MLESADGGGSGVQHVALHAEMAMMKSYALNQPDGKGGANRFVAYMVPKEIPREQPAHPSSRSPIFAVFFFFFIGKDVQYTSATITTSIACDLHCVHYQHILSKGSNTSMKALFAACLLQLSS